MKIFFLMIALTACNSAFSVTFELPRAEFDLIGFIQEVDTQQEDTLLDIARHYGIGQEEIIRANPDVDRWLPGKGTQVIIPSRYILPDAPRDGLVLNLPEMRLYYFPEVEIAGLTPQVQTYPVSIGRMDWGTPLGSTKIVSMQRNPAWRPPESIRREHAEQGDPLPIVVPPGPDNPLGQYAIRLGIPGYLIHGTNKAFGVGMRVSHGCIRMLPEDIEVLYPQISKGMPVHIINQPVKVGWYGGDLYLEVHPTLEEYPMDAAAMEAELIMVLDKALSKRSAELDEAALAREISQKSGLPVVISVGS
jgi:L,D-transpeptidase ErfK/SrfK